MTDDQLERALSDLLDHDAEHVRLTRPYWDPSVAPDPDDLHGRHRSATGDGRITGFGHISNDRSGRLAFGAITAGVTVVLVAAMAFLLRTTPGHEETAARSLRPVGTASEATVQTTTTMPASTVPASTTSAPMSITTEPVDSDPSTAMTTTTTFDIPRSTLGPVDQTAQPPVTTVGGPDIYYRFTSDIDLAWVLDGAKNMWCWRTPVDERCVPEPRPVSGVWTGAVLPTAADRTAILVQDPDRGDGTNALIVSFVDGSSVVVPVRWDDPRIDLGIARLDVPRPDISGVERR